MNCKSGKEPGADIWYDLNFVNSGLSSYLIVTFNPNRRNMPLKRVHIVQEYRQQVEHIMIGGKKTNIFYHNALNVLDI